MEYCIIIRGPAGVGKTTIAKKLARDLNADYISFDEIMEINKLDTIVGDGIPSKNFIKANEIILGLIKNKKRVVLDGCFYRKKQIEHLLNNLKTKVHIFTLDADIPECSKRNKTRMNSLADEDIKQVHNLVSKIKIGIIINTTGESIKQVVSKISTHMSR
ncbi:MAG: AAA family ATPase [Candidatus Heimdallarchaeaceae archaeon]